VRKSLILSALIVALVAPVGAQPTTGMGAMQYYVGNWACLAGPIGAPTVKATATFVSESGVLRQWVFVPVMGKMKGPYAIAFSVTYDASKRRYVQTLLDNSAEWGVSVAKPWSGNTEQWTDIATSDGKLGHTQVVRSGKDAFIVTGYGASSTKPNFKASCKRSS